MAPKRKKIYIEHNGRKWELVGIKAMLVPTTEEGQTRGRMIWADVKLDVLLLQAALDTRKMERRRK
jgi:hypothetical protein